jgi:4-amino-4-deoxy-L-arabinose transferase-like glycosyltransferase
MKMEKERKKENLTEKFIDAVFSKDNTAKFLIIILLSGFILRVIGAINQGVYGDDMHFAPHAINFLKSGLLSVYDQSAPLWYAVTDVFYKIFGIGQFGSRAAAVFFGTFMILLVYLIAKKFFNKKVALIAAFLTSFSPFIIRSAFTDMDVMAFFFILLSLYCILNWLDKEKKYYILLAGLFFGIAQLTKIYTILFLPGFFAFILYWNAKNKKKSFDGKKIKAYLLFLLIFGIIFSPVLIHNYLLHADKGISDMQFARVLGLGKEKSAELYSWDPGWNAKINLKSFFTGSEIFPEPHAWIALRFVIFNDPIIFILGVIGLFFLFKKKKEVFWLILIISALPFFYLTNIILLSKHFLFATVLLIFPTALLINEVYEKSKNKNLIYIILITILLFNIAYLGKIPENKYYVPYSIYYPNEIGKMMSYKAESIPENSLVLVDARIYRGQITWMFNDRHYLEASYFEQIMGIQENLSGEFIPMSVYFIECVKDDCGWGSIKDQPEFNQSMEQLVELFKANGKEIKTIYGASREYKGYSLFNKPEEIPYFKVYTASINLKPDSLKVVDSTHEWFFYPLRYENMDGNVFRYRTYTFAEDLLNGFGHLIFYLSLTIAFLSMLFVIFLILKKGATN